MVHVNSFLGCIKLETGGKIIAWLHMIAYSIVLILLVATVFLAPVTGDRDEEILLDDNQIVAKSEPKPSALVLAIIAVFIATSCVAIVVIAFRSLNAINTRNHKLMFEMMALTFAITCFYLYVFLIQLWLYPIQCLVTVIAIVICYYLFIVIYSHYRVFRKEYEQEAIRRQKANVETNV